MPAVLAALQLPELGAFYLAAAAVLADRPGALPDGALEVAVTAVFDVRGRLDATAPATGAAAAENRSAAGAFADQALFDLLTTMWRTDTALLGDQEKTSLARLHALHAAAAPLARPAAIPAPDAPGDAPGPADGGRADAPLLGRGRLCGRWGACSSKPSTRPARQERYPPTSFRRCPARSPRAGTRTRWPTRSGCAFPPCTGTPPPSPPHTAPRCTLSPPVGPRQPPPGCAGACPTERPSPPWSAPSCLPRCVTPAPAPPPTRRPRSCPQSLTEPAAEHPVGGQRPRPCGTAVGPHQLGHGRIQQGVGHCHHLRRRRPRPAPRSATAPDHYPLPRPQLDAGAAARSAPAPTAGPAPTTEPPTSAPARTPAPTAHRPAPPAAPPSPDLWAHHSPFMERHDSLASVRYIFTAYSVRMMRRTGDSTEGLRGLLP